MQGFILSLMSGLLFWPVIGFADLYKWTDDQGNLHITDMPPPLAQRKSATTVAPVPRSASPKKATVRPILPGPSQAEIHPVPGPLSHSHSSEEIPIQRPLVGLSPSQATLMSSWQVFDSTPMNVKAPVQRWKDEQGLDHFGDVLPANLDNPRAASQLEDVSVSHPIRRAKEQATVVPRTRHQSAE
ncbi:MAG: DUF4124 domain-containing protein [Nitrospira sp. LK70]|nr:DUF4124 domain-containing protein [Nitrospira sp. LK70]